MPVSPSKLTCNSLLVFTVLTTSFFLESFFPSVYETEQSDDDFFFFCFVADARNLSQPFHNTASNKLCSVLLLKLLPSPTHLVHLEAPTEVAVFSIVCMSACSLWCLTLRHQTTAWLPPQPFPFISTFPAWWATVKARRLFPSQTGPSLQMTAADIPGATRL